MLLFHGTTVENALDIIKNGFNTDSSIWTVSGETTYFFTDKFIKTEYDLTSEEEIIDKGVYEAMQQALITLAVQNPKDYRGAVLVFDSRLMKNRSKIKPDTSCDYMDKTAVCLKDPDMNGLVGFYVMDESYHELRYFTLSSVISQTYLNDVELNCIDNLMIKAISESSSVQEEFFEISQSVRYSKQEFNKQIQTINKKNQDKQIYLKVA